MEARRNPSGHPTNVWEQSTVPQEEAPERTLSHGHGSDTEALSLDGTPSFEKRVGDQSCCGLVEKFPA